MGRDSGQQPLDEVAQHALVRLRDEKVRGVVVFGQDFLRARDRRINVGALEGAGRANWRTSMMHTRTQKASSSAGWVRSSVAVRLFIPWQSAS